MTLMIAVDVNLHGIQFYDALFDCDVLTDEG